MKLRKDEARLKELEDEETKASGIDDSGLLSSSQPNRFGNVSLLNESILENDKPEDYNWAFEDLVDLDVDAN